MIKIAFSYNYLLFIQILYEEIKGVNYFVLSPQLMTQNRKLKFHDFRFFQGFKRLI